VLWNHGKSGAGIVADSNPSQEFQETINKAKAQLLALAINNEKFI